MATPTSLDDVLPGQGPIHDLIRTHDWSTSPLGAPGTWPQALRHILTTMLESKIPMSVVWGSRRVLLYNETYVEFLGEKHPAAAFGLPIRDVWPEIWSDIGPLIERAAAGDAFYLEDVPLTIVRNGVDEAAWFTFSYSPVRNDSGELDGMCSAVLETTSRVRAERRQALLLQLATTLGKLADPADIMRTAARLACEHLGVQRITYGEPDFERDVIAFASGHAQGTLRDLGGSFPLSGFGAGHVASLARGKIVVIDDVLADPVIADEAVCANYLALDARSVVGVPLVRSGKPTAVMIVNQSTARAWKQEDLVLLQEAAETTWNAVERARAEGALRALTATLEERIAERTAELERAMTALRETDRQKDQFLAMLAHELRNPLAPISAAATILGMPGVPTELAGKTSDIIRRQVKHMVGMVDDLLDVSRVTQGHIELARAPVAIEAAIDEAVEQARPLMEARRHDWQVTVETVDAGDLLVHADGKRLVQVLSNVLNNAAKYTPPGGKIAIRAEARGDAAVVTVADNGAGIPPDVLPYVFDLFVQGRRSADRSQGGLGIGLALVKRLVELHGGSVDIASPGQDAGTRVTIALPGYRMPGEPAPYDAAAVSAPGAGMRVMVVDDNADAADMLGAALRHVGFDVVVEHDPMQALEHAAQRPFDAFLLDIGMPVMDGNELARRLRRQPAHAGALLVAVSGYGSADALGTALEAGFDHHMAKPADLARLSALLHGARLPVRQAARGPALS
jgi:signal transduction histidine kinase/CheY-like chemotaxis protein